MMQSKCISGQTDTPFEWIGRPAELDFALDQCLLRGFLPEIASGQIGPFSFQ
jgi:hypothetical protein